MKYRHGLVLNRRLNRDLDGILVDAIGTDFGIRKDGLDGGDGGVPLLLATVSVAGLRGWVVKWSEQKQREQ